MIQRLIAASSYAPSKLKMGLQIIAVFFLTFAFFGSSTAQVNEIISPEKQQELDKEKQRLIASNANEIKGEGHFFPPTTVWVNTDYPLAYNAFTNKIVVMVLSDVDCIQCNQNISALEDYLLFSPAFQLVQILKSDPKRVLTRQMLLQFIQQQGFSHPIGVVPDYSGFTGNTITELPYFLVYEKGDIPRFSGAGIAGLENLYKKLEELKQNTELINSCYFNQIKPAIEYSAWADPYIENPTHLAVDDAQGWLFVNDAAHNRIVVLDGAGNCVKIVGNLLPGFQDDYLHLSRFDHAGGMVFFKDKLYIADTYNHRLRQVEFGTERVNTLVGNGQVSYNPVTSINTSREPLGLPTDVEVWSGKLYVASGATNQIFVVDTKSGMATLFATVPKRAVNSPGRVSITSMAASGKALYATMADGSVVRFDKKGKASSVGANSPWRISAICEWKGQVIGADPYQNKIAVLSKDKWVEIAGSGLAGDLNGNADLASFNHPKDMVIFNSELLIADNGNHLIRRLSGLRDGKVKNFYIQPSRELMGETAAHTFGEMVVMDTIYVSSKKTTAHIMLDLQGYQLTTDARNEIDMDERMVGAFIQVPDITEEGFSFEISSKFQQTDLYLEVYMTVMDPAHPGVYVGKRAYLVFAIGQLEDAPEYQDMIYRPNLLPY